MSGDQAPGIVGPGDLPFIFEMLVPSGLLNHLDRYRPHDGQPHTFTGEWGATPLQNVTLRDAYDAWVIGAFLASGLSPKDYPGSVYALPWHEMDPIAVAQNAAKVLEHRAGLTKPRLYSADDDTAAEQPAKAGYPPEVCIFCRDDYPELCPPRLHAYGNQAPRTQT